MKLGNASFLILILFLLPVTGHPEDFTSRLKEPVARAIAIRQKAQKARDGWIKERQRLEAEYRRIADELKSLSEETERLRRAAEESDAAVASLKERLSKISRITAELLPFLKQTYQRLSVLVEEDAPFLLAERKGRLANLDRLLGDPAVSYGEKLQKSMEALFLEAGYGNSVEVYKEWIDFGGKKILADILRLGRVALFCMTPDKNTAGRWNPAEKIWEPLAAKYNRPIGDAMEMAAKRRCAELVSLPIGRIAVP